MHQTYILGVQSYLAVYLARLKLKPAGMFFYLTATVWYFIISVASVNTVPPISIVDHSATFVLCQQTKPVG